MFKKYSNDTAIWIIFLQKHTNHITNLNLIRVNQFFRAILERTPAPGTKYFRLRRRHPIRRKEDLRPRRRHAVGGEEHLRPRRRHPRRRRHDGLEPGLLWFRSYKSMGRGPFFEQPTNLPFIPFQMFFFFSPRDGLEREIGKDQTSLTVFFLQLYFWTFSYVFLLIISK